MEAARSPTERAVSFLSHRAALRAGNRGDSRTVHTISIDGGSARRGATYLHFVGAVPRVIVSHHPPSPNPDGERSASPHSLLPDSRARRRQFSRRDPGHAERLGWFVATWRFFTDPGESIGTKLLFLVSLLYVFFPVDFVPDVIPVLGWLDDLGLLTIAVAFLGRAISRYRNKPLVSSTDVTRHEIGFGAIETDGVEADASSRVR